MNKTKIILTSLFMSWAIFHHSSALFAQEKPFISYEKKNVIKLNILSPILSSLSMGYERVVAPNQSFQLNFFYQDQQSNFGYRDELRGFGITPEYRFYLSERRTAPGGIFIAPFVSYRDYKANFDDYEFDPDTGASRTFPNQAKYANIGVGVTVGAQWVFKKKVSIDVWGGTGYSVGWSNENTTEPNNYAYFGDFPYQVGGGFLGRIGGTIGLLF